MSRITVLGGNGYVGAAVVAEARKRGHDVTAVSRTAPSSPVAGADYVEGSVLDADVLERTTTGSDVVLVALSPRGDMAGKVEGVVEQLIARLAACRRASATSAARRPCSPRRADRALWDVTKDHIPDDVKPEVQTGLDTFALCQESPESLDWFYVSPPADFGSWLGTESKGAYVLGGDVLLRDADGASTISADDLALAILDEIETPTHHRSRFTAIS